jgi:hypothetical protein
VVVKSPQNEKEKEETHFVQNPEFKAALEKLQGPMRQIFVEFLELVNQLSA